MRNGGLTSEVTRRTDKPKNEKYMYECANICGVGKPHVDEWAVCGDTDGLFADWTKYTYSFSTYAYVTSGIVRYFHGQSLWQHVNGQLFDLFVAAS